LPSADASVCRAVEQDLITEKGFEKLDYVGGNALGHLLLRQALIVRVKVAVCNLSHEHGRFFPVVENTHIPDLRMLGGKNRDRSGR